MSEPLCLENSVREHLLRYLDDLGSSEPRDLLPMVVACVERSVLQLMLEKAQGNQSRAAQMLGITRGTLRKKLQQYRLSADERGADTGGAAPAVSAA